jgi:hypothetical protein
MSHSSSRPSVHFNIVRFAFRDLQLEHPGTTHPTSGDLREALCGVHNECSWLHNIIELQENLGCSCVAAYVCRLPQATASKCCHSYKYIDLARMVVAKTYHQFFRNRSRARATSTSKARPRSVSSLRPGRFFGFLTPAFQRYGLAMQVAQNNQNTQSSGRQAGVAAPCLQWASFVAIALLSGYHEMEMRAESSVDWTSVAGSLVANVAYKRRWTVNQYRHHHIHHTSTSNSSSLQSTHHALLNPPPRSHFHSPRPSGPSPRLRPRRFHKLQMDQRLRPSMVLLPRRLKTHNRRLGRPEPRHWLRRALGRLNFRHQLPQERDSRKSLRQRQRRRHDQLRLEHVAVGFPQGTPDRLYCAV